MLTQVVKNIFSNQMYCYLGLHFLEKFVQACIYVKKIYFMQYCIVFEGLVDERGDQSIAYCIVSFILLTFLHWWLSWQVITGVGLRLSSPCHLVMARLGQGSTEELQHSNGWHGLKATSAATRGYSFTTVGIWSWQGLVWAPPCHLVNTGPEFNCWKAAENPKCFVWICAGIENVGKC